MSERKDGGHAFPNITPDMNVDGGPGMSLRDYFAAQALSGLYSGKGDNLAVRDEDLLEDAKLFYRIADAMLAARGQS